MPIHDSNERLICFDAREMWLDFGTEWSRERKEEFLIRTDIEKPLSVDDVTWHSVIGELMTKDQNLYDRLYEVWFSDDLRGLSNYLDSVLDASKSEYWVLGITVLHESYEGEDDTLYPSYGSGLPLSSPPYDSQEWIFLGYDVADEWFTTGLSNCGYYPEEVVTLGKKYGPFLNKYHLFTDKKKAIEYMKVADERVSEHAPFFVYGLYLVEDNT